MKLFRCSFVILEKATNKKMIQLNVKYIISAAMVALMFFGSSCKIQELEFNGVNDVSVGSMTSDDIEVTINVKLNNPNNFKIKVVKAKLDLFIGGTEAGTADLGHKLSSRKKQRIITILLFLPIEKN